jgi:hypothetical protein
MDASAAAAAAVVVVVVGTVVAVSGTPGSFFSTRVVCVVDAVVPSRSKLAFAAAAVSLTDRRCDHTDGSAVDAVVPECALPPMRLALCRLLQLTPGSTPSAFRSSATRVVAVVVVAVASVRILATCASADVAGARRVLLVDTGVCVIEAADVAATVDADGSARCATRADALAAVRGDVRATFGSVLDNGPASTRVRADAWLASSAAALALANASRTTTIASSTVAIWNCSCSCSSLCALRKFINAVFDTSADASALRQSSSVAPLERLAASRALRNSSSEAAVALSPNLAASGIWMCIVLDWMSSLAVVGIVLANVDVVVAADVCGTAESEMRPAFVVTVAIMVTTPSWMSGSRCDEKSLVNKYSVYAYQKCSSWHNEVS